MRKIQNRPVAGNTTDMKLDISYDSNDANWLDEILEGENPTNFVNGLIPSRFECKKHRYYTATKSCNCRLTLAIFGYDLKH